MICVICDSLLNYPSKALARLAGVSLESDSSCLGLLDEGRYTPDILLFCDCLCLKSPKM